MFACPSCGHAEAVTTIPDRIATKLADADLAVTIMARAVAEAMAEAEPAYWRRRADALAAALPRPGDFPGRNPRSTDAAAVALACRRHAALLEAEASGRALLDVLAAQGEGVLS